MRTYKQALALATAVFMLPFIAAAKSPSATNAQGQSATAQVVTINAVLSHTIDGKQDHPGAAVVAKLDHGASLADGTKLPSGSTLLGQVVQDDTQAGAYKLALRFDQARLKDGKVIPIHATIVGVSSSGSPDSDSQVWIPGTLQVDQLGVAPGVDLHSKIEGENSGVFVSAKNDVRLQGGSQLQFVVASAAATPTGF